jgi:thiamine kinase-like enzyme
MYNYHSATPYIANTDEYPSANERLRFLEAYVAHGKGTDEEKKESVKILEKELRDWRVVNHAFWCLWGVVMSEDDPELILPNGDPMEDEVVKEERPMNEDHGATAADFDYMAYADQKMRLFWGELASGRMYDDYKEGIEGSKVINDG